jgi:hypothetical protein
VIQRIRAWWRQRQFSRAVRRYSYASHLAIDLIGETNPALANITHDRWHAIIGDEGLAPEEALEQARVLVTDALTREGKRTGRLR